MPNDSIDLQEKLINYLKESPKSFKELKKSGDKSLKNDSTLNRYLKKLKRKGFIEKEYPEVKVSGIRFRYKLTKNYYEQIELNTKKSKLENWVSSKIESQYIFNFIKHFLEDENPVLTETRNFNSILLDIYSYIKYLNLSFKKITENPNLYVNCIVYIILNHPDQKYKSFQDSFQLNILEFEDLISDFKRNESLKEFQFKCPTKNVEERYLIAEDPILHNFKEQIETYFQKFLMCWEFPDVYFDKNYYFLYHFSYFVLDNEYIKIKKNSKDLVNFFQKNQLCLLIFIREYLWEFLKKLELESEFEPPFLLLDYAQKKEAVSNIFLSPAPLPSNEKKKIENFLYKIHTKEESNLDFLKNLILKVILKITESSDFLNIHEQETLVFYKIHLQFLLRVFQNIDNKSYQEFKKDKANNLDLSNIRLSYSSLSDEIFEDIIKLRIGFGEKVDYEKRSFTIRFLLERIDHFENLLNIGKMDLAIATERIKEVYIFVTKHFSKKIQYQFIKKIQKIDIEDIKSLIDSETIELFKIPNNNKIEKESGETREFPFAVVFPEKEISIKKWEFILEDIQNKPLKFIEVGDQLLYTKFGFANVEKLVDYALVLLKYYGKYWTIKYIDLFFHYSKWFINRKQTIDEFYELMNRQIIIKIFDLLRNVIKAIVYWEYRERSDTIQHVKQANRIYEEIKYVNNDLVNNFMLKLDELQKKIF